MVQEAKPSKETLDNWSRDPANWKLGIFYFNKEDKRIFPPKRIPWMGWTINFANPASIIVMVGLIAVVVALSCYFDPR